MQVIIAEKTPLEDGDMMKTISDEGEGTVPKSSANMPSNKSKFPQRNSSIGSAPPPKSGNIKECEWVLESGKVYVCGERFTGSDSLDQHMRRHKEKEIYDVEDSDRLHDSDYGCPGQESEIEDEESVIISDDENW